MRRTLLIALLSSLWIASATAEAQVLGYGVAGPAGYTGFFGSAASLVHAAGGGEVLAGGRVGAGGEFGLMGGAGGAFFVTSVNGVVHFGRRGRARGPSPFITGGYSRLSGGEGTLDAWNVGVGADIWTKERVGIRVEFRDHIRPDSRGAVSYYAARAGVVFR
jgi:hypothetical protein